MPTSVQSRNSVLVEQDVAEDAECEVLERVLLHVEIDEDPPFRTGQARKIGSQPVLEDGPTRSGRDRSDRIGCRAAVNLTDTLTRASGPALRVAVDEVVGVGQAYDASRPSPSIELKILGLITGPPRLSVDGGFAEQVDGESQRTADAYAGRRSARASSMIRVPAMNLRASRSALRRAFTGEEARPRRPRSGSQRRPNVSQARQFATSGPRRSIRGDAG